MEDRPNHIPRFSPIPRREFLTGAGLALTGSFLAGNEARAQASSAKGEWRYFGGDNGSTRYSPLDQINAKNVNKLQIVWRRPAVDPQFENATFSNSYQTTPLMVEGVMYASNGIGLVEAFDPATGKTIWVQNPPQGTMTGLRGRAPRGIAWWSSGSDARVFIVSDKGLYGLDAKTGKAASGFGDAGKVDLSGLGQVAGYYYLSPPVVCRDVVIVGSASTDGGRNKKDRPGDVTAWDVKTGKLKWTFHVIPRPGEFGIETWEDDSWSYTGNANVWPPFSADDELGYVYLPVSTPNSDWYGGNRPGNGLFGESLVCVDASTGRRVWHFQTVHHGLWDYDLPAAPILADIRANGKRIRAVLQITKTSFVFAFDRVTGAPVWPIEERPVQQSDTPGERASKTQPFPTRPPAFDRQGFSVDDVIDFTPEIKAEALAMVAQYKTGPLFTPPSLSTAEGTKGTIVIPGWAGGANWGGASFDPETGILYVPSISDASLEGLAPQNPATSRGPVGDLQFVREKTVSVTGPGGLPIMKPPYGRITAINMNRGEQVWQVPNGDGPHDHPLLKNLHLPPLGSSGRVGPLLTRTLLFVGEGDPVIVATPPYGGGRKFRAFDKATGKVIWETEFPAGTTGVPMTYLHRGKQYIVVAIGSRDHTAELVALALGA